MEVDDVNTEFPISLKAKYQIVVSDNITPVIVPSEKIGLKKLDGSEQNERHVVQAVTSGDAKVPIPKVDRIIKAEAEKSSVYFSCPPRCFIYDSTFYEPLIYYCDKTDIEFIRGFNSTHKFLQMTTKQLEQVFIAIEGIVKDFLTENPTIDQVLILLDDNAPPYPVVKAIFDHWMSRPKLAGSVLRFEEFPPDHCGIRQNHIKTITKSNKVRKSMNDFSYLRRLKDELALVRQKREDAYALLEEQNKKRSENIVFLRQMARKAQAKGESMISLVLEPALISTKPVSQYDAVPNIKSTLPPPPTVPAFLNWCQDQKLGEINV
ncbi:hypothetical protein TVAG_476780 [Trichomonas vaginalis G3]|uniref:Uncharacterized protein n=1 Tax=Trichomonas vaginalis (strain ATCC PRA-98 / G3) TaxID=412133 RepID=A2DAA1_TRIV3|nr:hypothetical protein TVAGG3_0266820 [Trichomonas vaginalis G3]EAY22749.1 hypothetical protein TVAG_476780 [Trichomonas vaginalis G3]KAI5525560.1 hypothetical protein TVAGG3_0266820 [Trichomonas vaginalis G3]|eukprot:XP_001583735.1 hypothetical protein [Trichomonas vaginalis G3]